MVQTTKIRLLKQSKMKTKLKMKNKAKSKD